MEDRVIDFEITYKTGAPYSITNEKRPMVILVVVVGGRSQIVNSSDVKTYAMASAGRRLGETKRQLLHF